MQLCREFILGMHFILMQCDCSAVQCLTVQLKRNPVQCIAIVQYMHYECLHAVYECEASDVGASAIASSADLYLHEKYNLHIVVLQKKREKLNANFAMSNVDGLLKISYVSAMHCQI